MKEKFGSVIKKARREKDITQKELAALVGITPSAVTQIESGAMQPRDETIEALASALEIDFTEVWLLAQLDKAKTHQAKQVASGNLTAYRAHKRSRSGDSILLSDMAYEMPEWMQAGPGPNMEDGEAEPGLPDNLVRVPVFDAQAGQPASWTDGGYPVGQAGIYEYLPSDMVDENSFCVTIHGDSMEPSLSEGDRVLVKPSEQLVNSRLCFVSFPGEDGDRMVKRYYRYDDTIVLRSDNARYPEITLSRENGRDVRIYRVWRSIRQE